MDESRNHQLEDGAADPLGDHVRAMQDQTEAMDNLAGSIDDLTKLLGGVVKKLSLAGLLGVLGKKKRAG